MGLNMPARTVLFTSFKKFDGKVRRYVPCMWMVQAWFTSKYVFRCLTSGEYIQMSGRAGRRGKDDKGHVILLVDQEMSAESAKRTLMVRDWSRFNLFMQCIVICAMCFRFQGQSDPLDSQFRLTYNMVLNVLRVPDIKPEFMLEKSLYQFQNHCRLPELHNSELPSIMAMTSRFTFLPFQR